MNNGRFKNQTAIITGGSRGIGKEIARAFAREGCSLVLAARTREELTQAATEIIQESGVPVETFVVDISNEREVRLMVEKVLKRFGRIDILVNNAAIVGPIGRLENCDSDKWEQTIKVNLCGTFFVTKAVLPCMVREHRGVIINLAGGGIFTPLPRFSAYAASKAAIARLTETLAEEVKPDGIRVNAIIPGGINTRMFEETLSAGEERLGTSQWEELSQRKVSGGGSAENVARLAVFLASPNTQEMTGRTISARWDSWEKLAAHIKELMDSDIFTLRRIKPEDRGKQWK